MCVYTVAAWLWQTFEPIQLRDFACVCPCKQAYRLPHRTHASSCRPCPVSNVMGDYPGGHGLRHFQIEYDVHGGELRRQPL